MPYVKLVAGCFFAAISMLWLLQIILYTLVYPPVTPLFNLYLVSFDQFFPMFGNITYALLSIYLYVCTLKGSFKLSMRTVCCRIHPMKLGGTYINAFLFNMGIIMICTVPLIQFCVVNLAGYSCDTDIYLMMRVQINYLNFFSSFYANNFFIYVVLIIACLTFPILIYRPREKPTDPGYNTINFKTNNNNN